MCQQFLFEKIPLFDSKISKLLATILEENSASQKVIERLGFVFDYQFNERVNNLEVSYKRFSKDLKSD